MIVIAVSDTHADWRTHAKPRFAEVERGMLRSVEVAVEREASLWVHTGDHCDPDSGPVVFRCVELLLDCALRLADAGIPSVFLAGNHDVIEDGSGSTVLSPLRAVKKREVHVVERPCDDLVFVGRDRRTLFVRCLPFTPSSAAYDPAEVLRRPGRWQPRFDAAIVLSHLTRVEGAREGDETSEMPRGRGVEFPFDALRGMSYSAVVQGHYHTRQVIERPGYPPLFVPGSLARLTHGEEDHEPGILCLSL